MQERVSYPASFVHTSNRDFVIPGIILCFTQQWCERHGVLPFRRCHASSLFQQPSCPIGESSCPSASSSHQRLCRPGQITQSARLPALIIQLSTHHSWLPLLMPSRRAGSRIMRLSVGCHRAFSTVSSMPVAFRMGLGGLRCSCCARDRVGRLRCGNLGLIFVPQAVQQALRLRLVWVRCNACAGHC